MHVNHQDHRRDLRTLIDDFVAGPDLHSTTILVRLHFIRARQRLVAARQRLLVVRQQPGRLIHLILHARHLPAASGSRTALVRNLADHCLGG